jgi:uncharacterized protein YegL
MPQEISQRVPSIRSTQPAPGQGTLLGVVVDLSGSMQTNLKNEQGGQYSRIESLSNAFQRAIEHVERLLESTTADSVSSFRLFIYGFGFCVPGQPSCDVLAALKLLKKKTARYARLQAELKDIWLREVECILEKGRTPGDAKEQLRLFIETELREKAIEAEQHRKAARFQRRCESICRRLDRMQARLVTKLNRSKSMKIILTPLVPCLLWILRGPTVAMARINKFFESWVQKKLIAIRDNAHQYSILLSEKVVTETKKAVDAHQHEIDEIIMENLRQFLDYQSHEFIRLYDAGYSKKVRKEELHWDALNSIYEELTATIGDIIGSQTKSTWEKNLFLYKQAAKLVKVKPNWDVLKLRTLECSYQAVWKMTEPYVQQVAEDFAKQRFVKAVLATIVQAAKDQEVILSLEDVIALLEACKEEKLSLEELPLFGASVMGQALARTLQRLQRDLHTPQNRGLRPILFIISDGEVIDQIDPLPIAEQLKRLGVTIICCFLANKNIRRPWVLRRRAWWFWPTDAKLMFSMASSVDDWPAFGEQLRDSRFVVKNHAKLFVQINHSEYLENFIKAVLIPLDEERRVLKSETTSVLCQD